MTHLLKSAFLHPGRLHGLDVARALALLGMFATHTMSLSSPSGVPEPVAVLAGKAAALFAVLAGFSIALSTRKYDHPGPAALSLVVRGLLIVAVGLILGSFTSHLAVILVNYGAMFMLAALCFRAPARVLGILAPAWLVFTPVLAFALRSTWDLPRLTEVANLDNYTDLPYLFTSVFFTGYYPVLQWFGYLLVGLLLARLDWSQRRTQLRVVVAGAASAAVAFLSSMALLAAGGMAAITRSAEGVSPGAWGSVESALYTGSYGTVPTDTWWWLAVAGPHTSTPFDMVYTAGLAALTIALCNMLCRQLGNKRWYLFPLLAAGSMPLTLYSTHVLFREANDDLLVHVAILVTAAVLWRFNTARPGPLEWGVSTVVHAVTPGPGLSPAASGSSLRHGEPATTRNLQE